MGKANKKRKPQVYKNHFYTRPWFLWTLLCGVTVGLLVLIGLLLFLKPYKERAEEFDFASINDLEVASSVYDNAGREIGRIYTMNRRIVRLTDLPMHFIQAITAAEDSRFFEHEGVDYIGIMRAAILNALAGRTTQGASTITQQLARNAYDLMERSLKRKIVEAFLARRIEKEFTKSEILEMYLNRIYFGSGFYGVYAAAQGYFGKEPRDLTIDESALLVGLVKSPENLTPLRHPERAKNSRNNVLLRMKTEKMLHESDYLQFKARPVVLNPKVLKDSYVLQRVRAQVIQQVGFDKAMEGGFRIYTTIDQELQQRAQEALQEQLTKVENREEYGHETYAEFQERRDRGEAGRQNYLQGAALVIDNRSGRVRALVGGRDYEDSEFNRALQARRPAGTGFTTFVYGAAFEQGDHHPASLVLDEPIDARRVMVGGITGILGEWGVESNVNYHAGEITARQALLFSKIGSTVRLGEEIGLTRVLDFVRRFGIAMPAERYFNKLFVGQEPISLKEYCRAFTAFPNGGVIPEELTLVDRIEDAEGRLVYQLPPTPPLQRVTDEETAFQVHHSLRAALEEGTGSQAYLRYGLEDETAAGKTSTAYNFTDNWFIGYNADLTCGVWAGFDFPRGIYPGAFSNETVLPIWTAIMNEAYRRQPPGEILPPGTLTPAEMCRISGRPATDYCYEVIDAEGGQRIMNRTTYTEYLKPGQAVTGRCHVHTRESDLLFDREGSLAPWIATPLPYAATGATSVIPQAPVVEGIDPYAAVVVPVLAEAIQDDVTASDGTTVRKASVVRRATGGRDDYRVSLSPPEPLNFLESF
ncbi:MAG: transglycosylase domain-containing protein [Verrucomicrobiota bacterium]